MITREYALDMTPGSPPITIAASQYDKLSREYAMTLTAGGAPFTVPAGAAVTVQGTKPDGTGFQYLCTVSGSTATFSLQEQMTILPGEIPCELVVSQTDGGDVSVLGTANFTLIVEPAALSDDIPVSETDLPLIQQALQAIPLAEAAAVAAEGHAEDAEAYAVGTRDGTAVASGDPAYHNNAEYYAGQAGSAATSAVSTALNGLVFAQDGDGHWGYMVNGQPPVVPFESGASVVAQDKTATPSGSVQIIVPDAGYDYLEQVTVNAIPYAETANDYGITVTIGG